eukprot:4992465-Prymnesium_polylepis.1
MKRYILHGFSHRAVVFGLGHFAGLGGDQRTTFPANDRAMAPEALGAKPSCTRTSARVAQLARPPSCRRHAPSPSPCRRRSS